VRQMNRCEPVQTNTFNDFFGRVRSLRGYFYGNHAANSRPIAGAECIKLVEQDALIHAEAYRCLFEELDAVWHDGRTEVFLARDMEFAYIARAKYLRKKGHSKKEIASRVVC